MASPLTLGKSQLIFLLCLPLAILMGYLMSDPLDPSSSLFVALTVGLLSIPLLMTGYHPALIFAWNAPITPAFLPGQPYLWVPLAVLGLGFAVVNRLTSAHVRFVSVPSLTRPLVFLFATVVVIAYLHGGFGLHSFGSESYGGRNYIYIFAAILGYFALSSQRIPASKANLYIGLFFLTGIMGVIPNLVLLAGPSWYGLYYLFPPVYAMEQAVGEQSLDVQFFRISGLTVVSNALLCWLMARYGLRRTISLKHPFVFLVFLVALAFCLFTGFRSMFVIFALTLAFQFLYEGLFAWKTVVPLAAFLLLLGAAVLPNANKLPIVVQRTISVLPAKLGLVAEASAEGSSRWRIEMWKQLLPEIPQYLLKGKGFAIDPTDLALARFNDRFNIGYSGAIAAGDYHNGPLSLVIPLGIWGVLGFCWFIIAALRYLHRVYRHGDPQLQMINTFLLAYFVARLVMFLFVFGGFFSDLFIFTGIVGFSVSLNGATLPQPEPVETEATVPATELAAEPASLLLSRSSSE